MHRLKSRGIITLTVIGLFAFSGIAMADTEDDTVFNYGYVEDEQFLIWNVSSIDYELTGSTSFEDLETTCSVDGETYTFTYQVDEETGEVTLLSIEPKEEPTDEPVEGVECGDFNAVQVTGPEGQVNHGMFLKAFNEAYEGEGRGCLVRHLAQSSLGIENQVTVEEAAEIQFDGEGEVTFEGFAANCIHGNPFADGEGAEGEGVGGPPQEVLDRFEGGTPGKPADVGGGRP